MLWKINYINAFQYPPAKKKMYQSLEEEEEERRRCRRRRSPFAWWCCCCYGAFTILGMIAMIITLAVVYTTGPAALPCTCNLTKHLDVVDTPPYDTADGKCIAFHRGTGELFFFTGVYDSPIPPGAENMVIIDTETPNIGPNLLPGGLYPAGMKEVRACVYYPPTGEFLALDRDEVDNLFSINPNGVDGSILGTVSLPSGFAIRGFALVNDTKLYGVDRTFGTIHQINPSTGAIIGSAVQGTVDGTPVVALFGITWDPKTKQTYVIFRNPNTSDNPRQRSIGRINVETGEIIDTCLTEQGKRPYSSMTFDANGRLWIFVGNQDPDSKTLFYTDKLVC